ncbi:MAG TPA: hypothetical protein VIS05_03180 [Ilumatobacter sp.]
MTRRTDLVHRHPDRGSILPLALVGAVVLALVVTALASHVFSGLRYSRVVENRADRLAAADGGLRYAIERLQNSSYAACLSNLGRDGYRIDFPVAVNGADVEIECTKGSSGIGDIKAWALIVTGQGVPGSEAIWASQAGNGVRKLLGGPVWISDPGRANLQADVQVEDGDIWYHRSDCASPSLTLPSHLSFTPAFRGPICVESPWNEVYTEPESARLPGPWNDAERNQPPTMVGNCMVFKPGRYSWLPPLGPNTYFSSGDYYFHDVRIDITNSTATGGWFDFERNGDQQFIPNVACDAAMAADRASGSAPGATFYLGEDSRIEIGNKGSLEIMRRLQGNSFVSIHAVSQDTYRMARSDLDYNDNVINTKSGENSDLAIHGLVWAPRAQLEFGNVTNRANGQLLGGAAVARVILQGSASATNFLIRVETTPAAYELQLDATATLDGQSTTMTAIVEVDDQGTTAVRSLRVRDL